MLTKMDLFSYKVAPTTGCRLWVERFGSYGNSSMVCVIPVMPEGSVGKSYQLRLARFFQLFARHDFDVWSPEVVAQWGH